MELQSWCKICKCKRWQLFFAAKLKCCTFCSIVATDTRLALLHWPHSITWNNTFLFKFGSVFLRKWPTRFYMKRNSKYFLNGSKQFFEMTPMYVLKIWKIGKRLDRCHSQGKPKPLHLARNCIGPATKQCLSKGWDSPVLSIGFHGSSYCSDYMSLFVQVAQSEGTG